MTCATCDHDRRSHWLHPGRGLRAAFHGECTVKGCLCDLYVPEPVPCDVHDWKVAPDGQMVCRRCPAVADDRFFPCWACGADHGPDVDCPASEEAA